MSNIICQACAAGIHAQHRGARCDAVFYEDGSGPWKCDCTVSMHTNTTPPEGLTRPPASGPWQALDMIAAFIPDGHSDVPPYEQIARHAKRIAHGMMDTRAATRSPEAPPAGGEGRRAGEPGRTPLMDVLTAAPLRKVDGRWQWWASHCSRHLFHEPTCDLCQTGDWTDAAQPLLAALDALTRPASALMGDGDAREVLQDIRRHLVAGLANPAAAVAIFDACTAAALRARGPRVDALKQALKPFAEAAQQGEATFRGDIDGDEWAVASVGGYRLFPSHFRAALAALSPTGTGGDYA